MNIQATSFLMSDIIHFINSSCKKMANSYEVNIVNIVTTDDLEKERC